MADRWMDERDRDWRERDWRRSEAYGRGGMDRNAQGSTRRNDEDRSWSGGAENEQRFQDRGQRAGGREDYGRRSELREGGGAYGASGGRQGYGREASPSQSFGAQPDDEQYGGRGQSPFGHQDYTRGSGPGPQDFRGDQAYRSYSQHQSEAQGRGRGGQGYGQPSFGQQDYRQQTPSTAQGEDEWGFYRQSGSRQYGGQADGGRSYNRDLERRYADQMRQPSSGASGGYDYERGYGDAGRSEQRGRQPWEERGGRDRENGGGGGGDFLQRAGERISSWFKGDHLMRGSRGDDENDNGRYREDFGREARVADPGHRGRGPKGYQRSDERISDEVHDRLTDDPWLDASHIEIEVKQGEVTLSGHVDNREAKHRAERLVEDLSGVRHVQNNLRVNPDASFTGAGRGFGSSALEAEMERNAQAQDSNNNGVSGLSGRTSTGALSERSTGTATETSVDPKTGVTRK